MSQYDKIRRDQTQALGWLLDTLVRLDEATQDRIKAVMATFISDPDCSFTALAGLDLELSLVVNQPTAQVFVTFLTTYGFTPTFFKGGLPQIWSSASKAPKRSNSTIQPLANTSLASSASQASIPGFNKYGPPKTPQKKNSKRARIDNIKAKLSKVTTKPFHKIDLRPGTKQTIAVNKVYRSRDSRKKKLHGVHKV